MKSIDNGKLVLGQLLPTDITNFVRMGLRGPRAASTIFVQPAAITRVVFGWGDRLSARIRPDEWPFHRYPVADLPKVRACHAHWEQGISWEATGIYDYMLNQVRKRGQFDGCRTLDDIVARYDRIDEQFHQVRVEGRLRSRRELSRFSFRELGGIRVHIFKGGEPVFSGSGIHRLAMARVLCFNAIPAMIGVIHPDAVPYLLNLPSGLDGVLPPAG